MKKLFSLILLLNFSIKAQDVTIGTQTWTSKNLDISTYRNGEVIPEVQDSAAWANLTTGAWCYYENSTAKGTIYGKLYNWYAVNDPRGLAPKGYHIPSDAEWTILTDYLGGDSIAGKQMKSTSGWFSFDGIKPCNVCKDWTDGYREGKKACKACANWTDEYRGGNTCKLCKDTKIVNAAKDYCLSCKNSKTLPAIISGNGTNIIGFAGPPGGCRISYGYFGYIGGYGHWWSSSESSANNAWPRYINYYDGNVDRGSHGKKYGFSVRCLRD